MSRVTQKLLKYFNGAITSTFFVPPSAVLTVFICLNWNKALLLAAWKLVIKPGSVKTSSSL